MKKYFISLSLIVAVVASCSVKETSPILLDGTHVTLRGDSYTATKVSIGEKDGETYPLLWFTGDAISIYSTDGTWDGEIADLYSGSSGEASGIFQTENELEPTSDMNLVILYPGNTMTYNEGVIAGSVSGHQTQRSSNSSVHVGNNCFAFAETSILAGQTDGVEFSLTQKTAFVKMVITAPEYAAYYLSGVQFSVEDNVLSGDVSYDMSSKEMTVTNGSGEIDVTVSNQSPLSDEGTIYFTAIPCDLTDVDVNVIISLVGDGTTTVTFPITIEGGKLESGCLSTITIEIDGDTLPKWYDPLDLRDLQNGWAYGPQNTYFIEQKTSGTTELSIDVKARGDFTNVKEPKYYGLLTGSSDVYDRKLCYLPGDITKYDSSLENLIEINEDYTITVYCYGQDNIEATGHWAVVGLYDEEKKIIWSYMIWKYLTGDEPDVVTYSYDVKVLDRFIGSPYSNSLAAELGTFDWPSFAYFQFCRKDAFPYYNTGMENYTSEAYTETTGVPDAIANPTTIFSYTSAMGNEHDWNMAGDWNPEISLWGGTQTGANATPDPGVKTIYDPCPEGYRVCDSGVLTELRNCERWEVDLNTTLNGSYTLQSEDVINPDSPFYEANESVLAYTLPNGDIDYWPFAGLNYASKQVYDDVAPESRAIAYTSNRIVKATNQYRSLGYYILYYSNSVTGPTYNQYKQLACPVRCQKE